MKSIAILRKFIKYFRPYLWHEVVLLVNMLLGSFASLAMPYFTKLIIDDVFPNKDFNLFSLLLAILFGIGLVGLVTSFCANYLYAWVSNQVMHDMRIDMFSHLLQLPMTFYDQTNPGDIVHRINNEINTIQSAITASGLRLVNSVLAIGGLTIMLCYLNWKLFLLAIVVFPFLYLNVRFFEPRLRAVTKLGREKNAELLGHFIERFENIKLIQSFNRYVHENNLLSNKIKDPIYSITHYSKRRSQV